ncbi:unnamed protein product [Adineta ricciae]|uniref:Uncharacterized protein n=1 Tax=Adineta ricciae TaxID=249248 RepID=A0A815HRX5_ADIRI|nr:unnamed protein product [Adineta ricciae]CAF1587643.1 unnamed protein product [Adineta ricciae]
MSVPTGMNVNIASQYHQVASQLQNYVHSNNEHPLYAARGNVLQMQPTYGTAYASHAPSGFYNSRLPMGEYSGASNNNIDDFATRFMRFFFRR